MRSISRGFTSGLLATIPMTLSMALLWKYALRRREKYPLPPREIEETLVEKAHVDKAIDLSSRDHFKMTLVSHFGYGAFCGAIYSLLVPREKSSATKGMIFGLGVWAASYLAWLPALNILKPATEHPARRNLLMILVHFVYGGSLGALLRTRNQN